MKMMKSIATAAMAAAVLTMSTAHADVFTDLGPDSEFSTAANWDTGVAPDFANNSTSTINNGFTVDRSVDSSTGRTFVEGGATLNVTGGTHSDARSGATIRNFVGRGSDGTVNQSGGSYDIGHNLSIGGGGAGGNGVYNLTGGSLNLSRGAASALSHGDTHGRGSLEVGDLTAGNGDGLFEVSGGSLITRFGASVGGAGVFSVVGSGASSINIGNDNNGDGAWQQLPGSTLQAAIDGGGITKIFIDDNAADGVAVIFNAGSLLDLSFAGVPDTAGTWTIFEAENQAIDTSGLALTGTTASGWSFAQDNTGVNGLLTATFSAIPEPSSLALLGLGGLALVGRRRK